MQWTYTSKACYVKTGKLFKLLFLEWVLDYIRLQLTSFDIYPTKPYKRDKNGKEKISCQRLNTHNFHMIFIIHVILQAIKSQRSKHCKDRNYYDELGKELGLCFPSCGSLAVPLINLLCLSVPQFLPQRKEGVRQIILVLSQTHYFFFVCILSSHDIRYLTYGQRVDWVLYILIFYQKMQNTHYIQVISVNPSLLFDRGLAIISCIHRNKQAMMSSF